MPLLNKSEDKRHKNPCNLAHKMFKHMNRFHDELMRHNSDLPIAGPTKLAELCLRCEEAGFTPDLRLMDQIPYDLDKKDLEIRGTFLVFRDQIVWEIIVCFQLIAERRNSEDPCQSRDLSDREQIALRLFAEFFEYFYI